jgi:YegS/Rv2252/BmrU family lipid kinase
MAEVLLVANPASANGRVGRRWKSIERALAPHLPGDREIAFTKGPRDAEQIVRRALRGGTELVVAVGGDGMFNEVVNGFFDDGGPVRPEARLAIVPVGTGSDLRRTLDVPLDLAGAAKRISKGRDKPVDVGRVTFRAHDGSVGRRYFLNVAEFGSGAHVVEKANQTTKAFGGRLSFLWAILTTMPKHKNSRVRFRADGRSGDVVVNNFIVANARHFGGGLTPAPHAEMDDGLLDIVIIGDIDFAEVRKNLGALRRGTHLSHPAITHFRAPSLEVECVEPALLDTDGELCGSNPTRFEVVPKALRIVC